MGRRAFLRASASAVGALALAACGSAPTSTARTAVTSTSPAGQDVSIGLIYPFSGPLAATGQDLKNGADMALEAINNNHPEFAPLPFAAGEGLPINGTSRLRILYGDSEGDANKADAEVQRLVGQEKVAALIGCYQADVTRAASTRAEQLQVPFVAPDSSSPSLTQRGYKWFFRLGPTDTVFTDLYFQFLANVGSTAPFPSKKIALLHESTAAGTELSDAYKQAAAKNGFEIAADVTYAPGAPDLGPEVDQLKQLGAVLLFQGSYVNEAILAVKSYQKAGYQPLMLLGQGAGFLDRTFVSSMAGIANSIVTRDVWSLDIASRKPSSRNVADEFKNKFGQDMNGHAARVFSAVITVADAMDRARSTDRGAIQRALQATNTPAAQLILPWDGIRFDQSGQNTLAKGVIAQLQGGAYKAVWPDTVASAKIIWPMQPWGTK